MLVLSKPIEEERIKQSVALEAIRMFAEAFGIDTMKVKIEKQKELGREPSPEEEIQTIQNEIKRMREHGDDPKKIVGEDELEHYLADGWDVQTVLFLMTATPWKYHSLLIPSIYLNN